MKKYRFIGNSSDVTFCKERSAQCREVGCKGKIHGHCCFTIEFELLSIGSDHYEEVRETVFRIERDNLYSCGGINPTFGGVKKTWRGKGYVIQHLKQVSFTNSETHTPIYLYQEYPEDAEVVEYALVEVKRTPVRKFVEGGE